MMTHVNPEVENESGTTATPTFSAQFLELAGKIATGTASREEIIEFRALTKSVTSLRGASEADPVKAFINTCKQGIKRLEDKIAYAEINNAVPEIKKRTKLSKSE